MTIKEIRSKFEENYRCTISMGLEELVDYTKYLQSQAEQLYKEGFLQDASDDFLAYANGYQINTGDYTNLHIRQTYGLRSVEATKAAAKGIMLAILHEDF